MQFTNFALIQLGHAIFGVGQSPEEAREDAAQWLDGGMYTANSAIECRSMYAARRSLLHGDLAIVPCTRALYDRVREFGSCTWAESDDGIYLLGEDDEDGIIKTLWIDGQNKDGSNAGPTPLELRRDGDRYRWYCQDYNEAGNPAGDCVLDTEVSGVSEEKAVEAAMHAWGSSPWNLRETP